MKEAIKKIYYCDFCKKRGFQKSRMVNHEEYCMVNPKNHTPCLECRFLEKTEIEVDFNPFTEKGRMIGTFRCKKLDKLIYPSIVLEKKLPQLHPETFEEQEPMPKSCESFKSGIISSGGEIYF